MHFLWSTQEGEIYASAEGASCLVGGLGGMHPQDIFIFRGSEMSFLMISWGHEFHKSNMKNV